MASTVVRPIGQLFPDGRELGRGAEWRELFVFDATQWLTPGRHVLAVNCYHGSFFAGMLFELKVELADGENITVQSDQSWRVVPEGVSRWKTRTKTPPDWPVAAIKAPLGGTPGFARRTAAGYPAWTRFFGP